MKLQLAGEPHIRGLKLLEKFKRYYKKRILDAFEKCKLQQRTNFQGN